MSAEAWPPVKERINLHDVEFKVPQFATKETVDVNDTEIIDATLNGASLDLYIKHYSWVGKGLTGLTVEVDVYTQSKPQQEIATLTIWLTNDKDGCSVSTDIKNTEREMRELGRTLWEAALRLIQKISDQHDLLLTHTVRRHPIDKLTIEKWNELFLPLLSKHGYSPTSMPSRWEKTYTPKK